MAQNSNGLSDDEMSPKRISQVDAINPAENSCHPEAHLGATGEPKVPEIRNIIEDSEDVHENELIAALNRRTSAPIIDCDPASFELQSLDRDQESVCTEDNSYDPTQQSELITGSYEQKKHCIGRAKPSHPKYAIAILTPVLLSWIFVTKQWYREEKGVSQKLWTLPLLILQCYPQYRALRVLYHAKRRKTNGWQRMKDAWEMEISHLEPFLESVPQVIIMLMIWISGIGDCSSPINGEDPLFITTFATSVTAASFGISKFLKTGPCRLIKSDKCCMGFCTLSYILLLTNIAATVAAKGFTAAMAFGHGPRRFWTFIGPVVLYLPQLVMACGYIYFALGVRKATKAILAHPALILTPAFTFWTFGNDFNLCGGVPRLRVSFRLTWINAILSVTELFVLRTNYVVLVVLIGLSMISLLLIQFLDKCTSCCCCFARNCLPMYGKVVYDVNGE